MAFFLLESTHQQIVSKLEKSLAECRAKLGKMQKESSELKAKLEEAKEAQKAFVRESNNHAEEKQRLQEAYAKLREESKECLETARRVSDIDEANRILRCQRFWTSEYMTAVEKLVSPDEHDSILFISGAAGTGKSILLGVLEQVWKAMHPGSSIAKVAPTGIAAAHIGGMTIHSFFGFPAKVFCPKSRYASWVEIHGHGGSAVFPEQGPDSAMAKQCEYFSTISLLMVDEVSMVSPDLIDSMDQSLRILKDSQRPFGGCKVVFFGDLGQLPPVYKNDDPRKPDFEKVYKAEKPYFFDAKVLQGCKPETWPIHLSVVFRQSEDEFMQALQSLRSGKKPSKESGLNKIIASCESGEVFIRDMLKRTTLFPKNAPADKTNKDCLNALDAKQRLFPMEISPELEQALYDPDHWFDKDDFRYPQELVLAVGARVMILKNNPREHYFNGSIGEVEEITDSFVRVKEIALGANPRHFDIVKDTIQVRDPRLATSEEEAREGGKLIGEYSQFPLKLAWAITIHKSQGQTYEDIYLDLGEAWELAQVYVAFSRIRRLAGLHLLTNIPDKPWKKYPERVRPWLGPPPRLPADTESGKPIQL